MVLSYRNRRTGTNLNGLQFAPDTMGSVFGRIRQRGLESGRFGIAARNGILMINHFQRLESDEGEPFGVGLVLRGAKERPAEPVHRPVPVPALRTLPLRGEKGGDHLTGPGRRHDS